MIYIFAAWGQEANKKRRGASCSISSTAGASSLSIDGEDSTPDRENSDDGSVSWETHVGERYEREDDDDSNFVPLPFVIPGRLWSLVEPPFPPQSLSPNGYRQ